MSDETTLLPCPFCGGEAETLRNGSWWCVACRTPFCCDVGKFDTESEAIAAWNTRTAHGTLTAEQVREAIERHSAWVIGNNRCFRDVAYEEIADELNAELGSGTCELSYGEDDDGIDGWYTQCGGWFAVTRNVGRIVSPTFCQLCGGEAVER